MKLAIKVVLSGLIFLFIFLIWESVSAPIEFNIEKELRYAAAIKRLSDIRKTELAFLSRYKKFTGNFDSLILFIKSDSIPIIHAEGSVPDTLSEKDAVKLKIVKRDTIYVRAMDSLFRKGYPVDSLPFVPLISGKRFILRAAMLKVGTNDNENSRYLPVFEAKVPNRILLSGLDNQLRINLDDEMLKYDKYPGVKVGSIETNVNNAGSWE